ncbi:MAG: response regulator [Pseudomonadota bacterium]
MFESIRSRLLWGFAALVTALMLVVVASYGYRQRVDAQLDEVLAEQGHASIAVGRMSQAMAALPLWTRLAAQDMVSAPERLQRDRDAHDAALREMSALRAVTEDPLLAAGQRAACQSFAESYAAMQIGDSLVWSAISDGDAALTKSRLAANERPVAEAVAAMAAVVEASAAALGTESMRDAQATSMWVLVGSFLLASALGFLFARAMVRTLSGRIQALNVGASSMALGELDATFGDRTRDELGELSRTLQGVVAFKQRLAEAAERVAAGDTSVEAPSRGARDQFAQSINQVAAALRDLTDRADRIAVGELADIPSRGPRDKVSDSVRRMTNALRARAAEVTQIDRLKSGIAAVNALLLGMDEANKIAAGAITAVVEHLGAQVGALFVLDADSEGSLLRVAGTYAYIWRKSGALQFRLGEGVVGQVAVEKKLIILQQVPEDYVQVVSGLGRAVPSEVCLVPVLYNGELRGVLEIGSLHAFDDAARQYLEQTALVIGAAFEIARAKLVVVQQQVEMRAYTEELLRQKDELEATSQELKAQQLELQQTNAEVEAQIRRALSSEERLKSQQAELEVSNRALEDRNGELERQKGEIEKARKGLAVQAEDLAIASKYKSEFLANMSHELRTPLNSLLLLSRSLRDNADGNLLPGQLESAGIIYDSGTDLLNLINEILDLAKIEAGRMELRLETCAVAEIARSLGHQFGHMARSQGLEFSVTVAEGASAELVTDPNRLGQVLKNLVGNALKFTDKGGVAVEFAPVPADAVLNAPGLVPARALAIRVTDTGIGVPLDKQKLIFEAFQQADSGDRRRFGGTGLGLSISRNIAALLGGEIQIVSEPGRGSTFTLVIPTEVAPAGGAAPHTHPAASAATSPSALAGSGRAAVDVADDRDAIEERDRVILVVEDDVTFCGVLCNEVRNRGFKCLAAVTGEQGLELAKSFRPSGVILDLNLPGTDGWAVLRSLKQDVETRHIPVHIVSAEDASLDGLRIGAIGHAHKPLTSADINAILATIERSVASAEKHVLVVEDDPIVRRDTMRLVGNGNVHVHEAASGAQALAAMRTLTLDLVVLDLGLEDMQGLELLRAASDGGTKIPPVIIYTARDLTPNEEMVLRQYAETIIIKDVRSNERLVDEVALFLHRVVNDLPQDKKSTIRHLYESDEKLRGKTVLIVEDDMRTMFAMAKLLASHGIHPLKAADGSQALEILAAEPVDLVLLDMMMPVMDGYETAGRVRSDPRLKGLPIIALTAKAMREDRQRCIEAGASDYLAKPIDQDRLLSLLRIWLCR